MMSQSTSIQSWFRRGHQSSGPAEHGLPTIAASGAALPAAATRFTLAAQAGLLAGDLSRQRPYRDRWIRWYVPRRGAGIGPEHSCVSAGRRQRHVEAEEQRGVQQMKYVRLDSGDIRSWHMRPAAQLVESPLG